MSLGMVDEKDGGDEHGLALPHHHHPTWMAGACCS